MSLDANDLVRQRAAEKAEKQKVPPLNPEFPWKPVPFDPFAFGLQNDPFPPDKEPTE